MKFKVTDLHGPILGHLVGDITASYQEMYDVLGKPNGRGDDHKITTEWRLRGKDESGFYIYDWKQTNLFHPAYPSLQEFRSSRMPYEWHIGGKSDPSELVSWLNEHLKAVRMPGVC